MVIYLYLMSGYSMLRRWMPGVYMHLGIFTSAGEVLGSGVP
jgi:hypothetical protein